MPYLDRNWVVGSTELAEGTWVPERDWNRWQERGLAAAVDLTWRRAGPSMSPPPKLSDIELKILAADMASAEADAWVYANLIERMKSAPADATADDVVERMQTLGFASASWPEAVGGPPPHESPRPFRRVFDWLFKQAEKVGKFLLNCLESAMATLAVGISAVTVSSGLPIAVQLGFEVPTTVYGNWGEWVRVRGFLDARIEEVGRFASDMVGN